jgi:Ferritin-like domain
VVSEDGGAARRELLAGAGATVAAGATVVLAGCGSNAHVPRHAVKSAPASVRRRDIAILNAALYLERRTVAAYTAGIPLLTRPQRKACGQYLNEELEHTGELLALIKAAKGVAIPRAPSYDIGHPRDGAAVLALLHELERQQIAGYVAAIPKLSPGPVRSAVASILASDAQHIAMIRLEQGEDPLPTAFVNGRE